MTDATPMDPAAFEASPGLEAWRVLGDGAYCFFATTDFGESARLVAGIGEIAEVRGHPPAIDIRADGVTVRVVTATDDSFGMTELDREVARRITAVAAELGLSASASAVQSFLVIPGAPSGLDILPFWRAVLGYEPRADSPQEDLVDPHDRGPGVWLEGMDAARADGGGAVHVAVWVPPELAEARVAAAVAAGGRIVRDEFAPSWWTLADAAGNEADVATIRGRA